MTASPKRHRAQIPETIPAHQWKSLSASPIGNPWTARASFQCYGARIGLRCNSQSVLNRMLDRLPPYSKISAFRPSDAQYSLYVNRSNAKRNAHSHAICSKDSLIFQTRHLDEALNYFESSLHFAVATLARPLFVHAGVVMWRGRAILIPGRSFSGKTSLVEELVRSGATYYSDEFAVLDRSGKVHPYPKPLSIRQNSQVSRKVECDEIGGSAGTMAARVGGIIVTSYAKQGSWRPTIMTPAEAMMALIENTVMARDRASHAMKILPRTISQARAWSGPRGEAKEVARWMMQSFAA